MNFIKLVSLITIISFSSSCIRSLKESSELVYSPSSVNVIPAPNEVAKSDGFFKINKRTSFVFDDSLRKSAEFLDQYLSNGLGYKLRQDSTFSLVELFTPTRYVMLSVNDSITNAEGYRITISEQKLLIEASTDKGAFFAVQTIRQLLPASFENGTYGDNMVKLDLLKIEDSPEYAYRGFMLDVARHFYSVEDVKHLIDLLSVYKINTLHLHLSDDQGWRIEIKSWPNLTTHGSKSSVKNEKGGFYTQDDYKEIQNYASKHQITIIPEIDMPGHTNAALSSYAELNCDNKVTKPYHGTKVGFSSLCVDKEITYEFLDDVIGELADITTGDYIHIGGDESHSTKKSDYITFIERAITIVKSHDKKVIGWDEIAHSDIDSETIVQYWGKAKNAKLGVSKGAKIIMSPSDKIYLDIKYNDSTKLGITWAGRNPVDDAYNWNPESFIKGVDRGDIFGIEAPLWSETIVTRSDMEFLLFPRLPGVAETAWSKQDKRNWDNYKLRLAKQKERFEVLEINYYRSPLVDWGN